MCMHDSTIGIILSTEQYNSSSSEMLFSIKNLLPLSLLLALSIFGTSNVAAHKFAKLARLGVLKEARLGNLARAPRKLLGDAFGGYLDGFVVRSYAQTLDHFGYRPESYTTFRQRYAINYKYWGGAAANSSIFVYTGDEASLDGDLAANGFSVDNAARFKALLLVIEHRYYGESNPFGSREEAYRNSSTLGYFSSSQALADYAELIVDLKKNLSAENCPVIAMGGSYGGMLASWFRLKYPHVVLGALASSAPILYFDNITPENGYYSVVTKDFREASESCYRTIRESWFEIDKVASEPNGLGLLSQKFHTCKPLNSTDELKEYLESAFSDMAQYDLPPDYPVKETCALIDRSQGADVLGKIVSGIRPLMRGKACLETGDDRVSPVQDGWSWQVCTEMVMPMGCGSNDTMFRAEPFDMANFTMECQKDYGITPRPHWITTEFGGHNIKSVLEKFGSNIIFSNGLRDPYSSGGVLQNISSSIVAIYTTQGAHCLDILPSKAGDADWLVAQRKAEVTIIDGWLEEYKAGIAKTNNVKV